MTTADTSVFDAIDGLLDTNLDDIADLPEYADYLPTGHYKLKIAESELKSVDTKDKVTKADIKVPVIQVTYEVMEVMELKDPAEAELVKTGMRFNESFWLNGDEAKKQKTLEIFKVKFKGLAEKFSWPSVRTTVEGLKGLEILSIVKSTQSKDDAEKFFLNTKNIQAL